MNSLAAGPAALWPTLIPAIRVALASKRLQLAKLFCKPFVHQDVASPFQASGPIFVRELAVTAKLAANAV